MRPRMVAPNDFFLEFVSRLMGESARGGTAVEAHESVNGLMPDCAGDGTAVEARVPSVD